MSHWLRLYWVGHRISRALMLVLLSLFLMVVGDGDAAWAYRLNHLRGINIGALCAVAYGLIPVVLYRNELSRLEAASTLPWNLIDLAMMLGLWGLPWLLAWFRLGTPLFACQASICLFLTFVLGVFLRRDTLTLILVGQFVVQLAMWGTLLGSPLLHALFLMVERPSWPMVGVSLAISPVTFALIQAFKAGPFMPSRDSRSRGPKRAAIPRGSEAGS